MIKQRVFKRASIFLRLLFCLVLAAGGMALAGTGKVFAADGDENWKSGFTLNGVDGGISTLLRAPDGSLYVAGSFGAADDVMANNVARWDGSAWHALGEGITGEDVEVQSLALDSSGNLYAGLWYPEEGDPNVLKWDGTSWTGLGSNIRGSAKALAVNSSGKVCTGGSFELTGTSGYVHLVCFDGTSWAAVPGGPTNTVYALAFDSTGALYAGGSFTSPAAYIAKWDSTTGWSTLKAAGATNGGTNNNVNVLVPASEGGIYVGGGFTTAGDINAQHLAKWDGSAWSTVGGGVDFNVNSLTVDGTNFYASGYIRTGPEEEGVYTDYISRWDGVSASWSQMAESADESLGDIAVMGDGTLYASGGFTRIEGVVAPGIARWTGSAWEALSAPGNGIKGDVRALVRDGQGNLYAGGSFSIAGGVPVKNIAKWDGTRWSALGSGMDQTVEALALDSQGNLYAGGRFTTAGGVNAAGLAKWDGANWQEIELDTTGEWEQTPQVYALLFDSEDNLYVGGYFGDFSSWGVNNILLIKSSGGRSDMVNGLNGSVSALALDQNGVLYAGGGFTEASDFNTYLPLNHVAYFTGNRWYALGNGVDGSVNDLAVDANNQVYAGGNFTSPGAKVAHWDGITWSAVGSGMDEIVKALIIQNGTLIAAGRFTSAGGTPANNIAAWDGNNWSALGSGTNTTIYALQSAPDGFFAGGNFSTAGGKVSTGIARYQTGIKRYLPLVER